MSCDCRGWRCGEGVPWEATEWERKVAAASFRAPFSIWAGCPNYIHSPRHDELRLCRPYKGPPYHEQGGHHRKVGHNQIPGGPENNLHGRMTGYWEEGAYGRSGGGSLSCCLHSCLQELEKSPVVGRSQHRWLPERIEGSGLVPGG